MIKVPYAQVPCPALFITFYPGPVKTVQALSYHLLHVKEDFKDNKACNYFVIFCFRRENKSMEVSMDLHPVVLITAIEKHLQCIFIA